MDVLYMNLTDAERRVVLEKAEKIAKMKIDYAERSDPSEYETARALDCSGFFRRVYHEAVDTNNYVIGNAYPSAQVLWESLEPTESPEPGDLACYSRTNDEGERRWHVMLVTRGGVLGACDELGKVGTQSKADYSPQWRLLGYRKFPGKSIAASDALDELAEVWSQIDELCDELIEADSHWERCFDCPNGGSCCSFSQWCDQSVTEPEWVALKEFLDSNTEVRDYALERLVAKKYCLFHNRDADKCPVHDVRPLICRLVPLVATEKSGTIQIWNPNSDCSNMNDPPKEIAWGFGAMKGIGKKFIVEVDGHHRISIKRLDYFSRFCGKYRKKKMTEWLEEIRH